MTVPPLLLHTFSERLQGALVGLVLILGYFHVFRRSIQWNLDRGHVGRAVLALFVGLRQVALGAILVVLWRAGFAMEGVAAGILSGTVIYRYLLVRQLPPPGQASAFTGAPPRAGHSADDSGDAP